MGRTHLDLHRGELDVALGAAPVFDKTTEITAVQADRAGRLTTVLVDGTVETTKDYAEGEWIVTNPDGERYVIPDVTFRRRHRHLGGDRYQTVGAVRAIRNPTGGPISIDAPWEAMQYANADCMIAEAIDPDHPERRTVDRYLIGGAEFATTYTPRKQNA